MIYTLFIYSSSVSISTTAQPEVLGEQSCSEYTDGWGLQGSDWGCCGNYEGCCLYASLICYIHDAMCRCCDVGDSFCGPTCKPEVDCVGDFREESSEKIAAQYAKYRKIDEDDINKNESNIVNDLNSKTPNMLDISNNVTEGAASVFAESQNDYLHQENIEQTRNNAESYDILHFEIEKPPNTTVYSEIQSEYLDIEALEQTLNNTDNYDSLDFEIEQLLNETETLLEEHDQLFGENGSGEAIFKPEI